MILNEEEADLIQGTCQHFKKTAWLLCRVSLTLAQTDSLINTQLRARDRSGVWIEGFSKWSVDALEFVKEVCLSLNNRFLDSTLPRSKYQHSFQ